MNRRKIGLTILVVAVLTALAAYAQVMVSVVETAAEVEIRGANQALRQRVSFAMYAYNDQCARRRPAAATGYRVNTGRMVVLSGHHIVIVCAGAYSLDKPAPSEVPVPPDETVELGLFYISRDAYVRFGDGITGSRLPAGFHAARLHLAGSAAPQMELYDSLGKTTALFPIAIGPATSVSFVTASLDMDVEKEETTGCVDWHGKRLSVKLCLTFPLQRASIGM